jgi:hypothetical protein
MNWIDGLKLINKALEKQNEQREWEMWISIYPKMDEKNFISFEKFKSKKQVKSQAKKHLTAQEIIEQAEEIRKLHQGTHEGVRKE